MNREILIKPYKIFKALFVIFFQQRTGAKAFYPITLVFHKLENDLDLEITELSY